MIDTLKSDDLIKLMQKTGKSFLVLKRVAYPVNTTNSIGFRDMVEERDMDHRKSDRWEFVWAFVSTS